MTPAALHARTMLSLSQTLDRIASRSSLTAPEFAAAVASLAGDDAVLRCALARGERSRRPPAPNQARLPELLPLPGVEQIEGITL